MKKKAVVFWITAASVAAISTVLYIRSLLAADKEELQKELKDHNNDDMDEYLYDSLKDNDYLV